MATTDTEPLNQMSPNDVEKLEKRLKKMGWPSEHKYGGKCLCKAYLNGEVPLKYIQPEKPRSFKPIITYTPPCSKFPNDTVYKRSYEPIDPETLKHCRPSGGPPLSFLTPCGDFSPHTTQRLSYGPIPCVDRSERVYPHEYDLKGHGPMQDITTHRHDYTPKPIRLPKPFRTVENLGVPDTPMERRTTHKMSYTPIDLNCIEPPKSCRPIQACDPIVEPFPKDTVYKTSYLPVKPDPKLPKSKPVVYEKPKEPFTGRTVYNGSFMPPGRFVEDNEPAVDGTEGCYCVYPGKCVIEKFKKAHDYSKTRIQEEPN